MGARETALNVLIACRREKGWSNGVLKSYISRDRLDRREAALATRLCYGVVQNRLLLDHYLRQLLHGKPNALHPVVRDILHLGLYQLLLTDKIPQSAAVNESVDLAKRYCRSVSSAPGLVNAVLRAASAEKLQEPTSYVEKYSHPQALVDLLKAYVGGRNLEKMLQSNNTVAPTVVQVNTLRTDVDALLAGLISQGVTAERHPWLPQCLVLSATGDLERLPQFREGLFYVQDAAARLVALCAGLLPDSRVLDCCAAPGGKSFAAALEMAGTGSITACDIHPHKTALIEKGAQRLGLEGITALCQDASVFCPQWEGAFDTVIADVPCSGYGIIRKKPDIRYKAPSTMTHLPALQLEILSNQARYVKPGGVLMYSTCTLVRDENEGVVEHFLQAHPVFEPEPMPLPPALQMHGATCTLIPGMHDTDGFFIAKFRKKQ